MANLNISFVYKKFKAFLNNKIGKDKANIIWNYANKEYKNVLKEYKYSSKDEKIMILPLYSIYISLNNHGVKDSLLMLKDYAKETGKRMSNLIYKVTSLPFVPQLLWKNMTKLMRANSSPKKGYERIIVSETKELVAVDIIKCPLQQLTIKLGTPELASVVCIIDKGQMMGFRSIDYTRTTALGDGDSKCDYRLKYNKNKNRKV